VIANRPSGRPKKAETSKEQAKPSTIPKRQRLKAKRNLDIILDMIPRLKELVEEYQKLICKHMAVSRHAPHLVSFRERRPIKRD